MTNPAWKQEERKVARALGGERTPLSGSNSRHTAGDAIQTPHFVDCKLAGQSNSTGQKHYTLPREAIEQVRDGRAQEEKDLGLLTVRFKHCSDRYAILPSEMWGELNSPILAEGGVDFTDPLQHKSGGSKTSRIYREKLQQLNHVWMEDAPRACAFWWVDSDEPDAYIITWESFLYLDGRLKVCPECLEWQAVDAGHPHECPDCEDTLLRGVNHA